MKKNQINKVEFMEFVSKAFDLGGNIEICFSHEDFTEEFAKEISDEFGEIVGGKTVEAINKDKTLRWFKVYGDHKIAVFHKDSEMAE